MTKLPRITAKIFASNAALENIGQFGSALSGSKVTTGDIEEIQALPAYEEGWSSAVISTRNYPTLQEMNGVQKSFSQQIAYILQQGIPEYDTNTTYYANTSFCQVNGVWYQSVTDDNIGNNPAEDTTETNWKKVTFGSDGGNNPFFFGMWTYSQVNPDNASWLLSDNQWNAKGVYPDYYNWILTNANEGTSGFKLSTADDITDRDWVINATDETFRLPLSTGTETMFTSFPDYIPTSTIADTSLYKGSIHGLIMAKADGSNTPETQYPDKMLGISPQGNVYAAGNHSTNGEGDYLAPLNLGINLSQYIATQDKDYNLYFYVGNVVENADLINVGEVLSALSTKLGTDSVKSYVTETYNNGASGYRIYSDGYCEQWALSLKTSPSYGTSNVAFLKKYKDTNYSLLGNYYNDSLAADEQNPPNIVYSCPLRAKTQTGFTWYGNTQYKEFSCISWRASGYLAQGEY